MEIVRNDKKRVTFGSLKVGDVFICNGAPCMKVDRAYVNFTGAELESLLEGLMDCDDLENHVVNALSLDNNQWYTLSDEDEVTPVKARLIIE